MPTLKRYSVALGGMPQRLLYATFWIAHAKCMRKEKWLRKIRSHFRIVSSRYVRSEIESSGNSGSAVAQRPIRGTSPLRIAISAFAISTRSMMASRRLKRVDVGERATVAVLDILALWLWGADGCPRCLESDLMYTRYQNNGFVC